jgi:hypothetical protein
MPAQAVVKDFPSTWTQERNYVLEVRGRTRRGTKRRRIEWASPHREKDETREPAADLEASRMDVFVRQAIARKVEERSEEQSGEPRPTGRAGGSARSHMEGDDHATAAYWGLAVAWCPQVMLSHLETLCSVERLLSLPTRVPAEDATHDPATREPGEW